MTGQRNRKRREGAFSSQGKARCWEAWYTMALEDNALVTACSSVTIRLAVLEAPQTALNIPELTLPDLIISLNRMRALPDCVRYAHIRDTVQKARRAINPK